MTGFSVQPELVEGFVTVMNGEDVSPCNHRRVSPNSNLHQKSRFDPGDSFVKSQDLTLEIPGDSALALS
jgi:hypothetical protein